MTASSLYHITIELLGCSGNVRELTDDETTSFENSASNSRVIGFGTPFHGMNATVDGYVNRNTQICGVASLFEIPQRRRDGRWIHQTKLVLVVVPQPSEVIVFPSLDDNFHVDFESRIQLPDRIYSLGNLPATRIGNPYEDANYLVNKGTKI
ncbi:hypothetical protein ACHAP8_007208 [Fusarium lateritium]